MPNLPPRSSWPSLASTLDAGMMIAGTCGACQPPRRIDIPLGPLIERYGPDAKTRDVMDRVTCAACGGRVTVSLAPVMVPFTEGYKGG